jgi:hypothetical protein
LGGQQELTIFFFSTDRNRNEFRDDGGDGRGGLRILKNRIVLSRKNIQTTTKPIVFHLRKEIRKLKEKEETNK